MSNPSPQSAPEEQPSQALVKRADVPENDALAQIEERLTELRETLVDLNAKAVTFVRERPVISIAGALAFGYVVGRAAARRWLR